MKRFRVLFLVLSLPWTFLGAQQIIPRSSFVLNLDFARFKNTEKAGYVEVYYAFFPQLVTYESSNGRYHGAICLKTEIRNPSTNETPVNDQFIVPLSVQDTADPSFRNTLVTQAGHALPFGDYIMKVTAYDSLNMVRIDTFSIPLAIQMMPTGVSASDLELCSTIKQSENNTDPFFKNSFEVVPNPTLVFGASNYPVVYSYAELYNLDPAETYIVKTLVADANGKIIRESSKKRKYGVTNAVEVNTTNVTTLSSGKFKLQLYVLSQSFQILVKTEKVFYAFNPQIANAPISNAAVKESELNGLTAEELAREFETLRYYATDQELKSFSQITAESGRREFLGKFWSQVEMGKMGRAPVTRTEFLLRVEKANKLFRSFSREGWRTDRGRIYLLNSEPDEIDRHPSSEGGKPYEVWYYYQIENGVEFVFVDRTGFGEYVLVHSTKRGELRDDQWQRLLQ